MEKYSVKPNKKLNRELLLYGFSMFAFIVIIYFSLNVQENPENLEAFILLSALIVICYCLFFLIPVFILQENYLKYNKKTELILLQDRIVINTEEIEIESIQEVNIYATYQHFSGYTGSSTLTYNEYFYYIEIIIQNSQKYILTSLLDIELDKKIKKTYPELNFNEKVKWFPLIKQSV